MLQRIRNRLGALRRDQRGGLTTTEAAIILAAVVILALPKIVSIGAKVQARLQNADTQLNTVP